jgi:MFS transporter, PPP family, 3-phenylpropionic acid transporter
VALRLSLFYAAVFSVVGVQLPLWPLFLSDKGLAAAEIGQLLGASYLIKILSNPLVGHMVDRRGDRRRPLLVLAAISLAATLLFGPLQGFLPLLLVTLIGSAAFTAMMPLGDSMTMVGSISHRLDYGRIRLWGSLSFIGVSGLAGLTLVEAPHMAILWASLVGLAFTVVAVALLPDIRSEAPARRPPPIRSLLASPAFLLFLGAASLTQSAHMIYYGFATLHWRAAGLSGGVIGGLWAEGVIAEVVLFAFGARLVGRFGPAWLMAAAGLAGMVRWTVLAGTTDPLALASVQFLHAFTFGANHLGAMHFINRAAPASLSARAQSLYSAVTAGVAPGIAMLAAGWLYQALAGRAFLVMSAASAGALILSLLLARKWSGTRLTAG